MGKKLRKEVERQLLTDLKHYGFNDVSLLFDWSESCIEGKCAHYLDGSLDKYSGIKLFKNDDKFVAEGWMDFIYEKSEGLFIVYWNFLDVMCEGDLVEIKGKPGMPDHIFNVLPRHIQYKYFDERL